MTRTIQECIRDPDKSGEIPAHMVKGTDMYGMQTFDQHILEIYNKKLISGTEALRWASNPEALAMAMRGINRIGK